VLLRGDNGCGGGTTGCREEPLTGMTLFWEGDDPPGSVRFTATVLDTQPLNDIGFRRYRLDVDGRETEAPLVLAYRDPLQGLPLEPGIRYDMQVDVHPGWPSLSSVLVWDDAGLLHAAVSDLEWGGRMLPGGVPGFDISVMAAGCPDRSDDSCYDSIHNLALTAVRDSIHARLFNGETAEVNGYRASCLIAQHVEYSDRCQDAGLLGISFVIRRMAEE